MFDLSKPVSTRAKLILRIGFGSIMVSSLHVCVTSSVAFCLLRWEGRETLTAVDFWRYLLLSVPVAPILTGPLFAVHVEKVIKDLYDAREQLDTIAKTDPLTQLLNLRGFDHAALPAFAKATSTGNAIAVVACDIDFFKSVNDKHGHAFGDATLREVARLLRSLLESSDAILGRAGGEEFVILLPEAGVDDALEVAETIRMASARHVYESEGKSERVTLSFGVAARTRQDRDLADMLGRADAALYEAKKSGRNRVVAASRGARVAAVG